MAAMLKVLAISMALTIVASQNLDCTCGQNRLGTRVVGGTETVANKYPWQVALVTGKGHNFCGGLN